MEKKGIKVVGKQRAFIITLLLFCNTGIGASVTLTVGGDAHYEAVLGEVFSVDLIIKDIPKGFADPVIKDVPHAHIQRSGLYMSSVNGKSEIRYSYHVSFDEIGSYNLGPVTITKNNKNQIQSNMLSIVVSHGKQEAHDTKQDLFLRLTTDTDVAVIGQKIICTLSCYVKRRGITIERIIPPHLSSTLLANEQKTGEMQEVIDGVHYAVVRWTWEVTPKEEGDLVIPAAAIEYATQSKNRGSFLFSLFSDSTKRLYSNACVVQVSPLPEYNGVCHAVGQFSDFSASILPTIIKKGEATTITLMLHGYGTFLSGNRYDLKNVPNAIRYYAVDPKHDQDEYVFEYIAQGVAEGVYSISEQIFTFFNTGTKQYEQLYTTPLELHITENLALVSSEKEEPFDVSSNQTTDNLIPVPHEEQQQEMQTCAQQWFNERSQHSSFPEKVIPWLLFFSIILFSLFVKWVLIVFANSDRARRTFHRVMCRLYALVAIASLYRIKRKDDIKQLRQLFVSLIAYVYQCSENEIYLFLPDINEKLRNILCEGQTFDEFWELLSAQVYTAQKNPHEKEKIYTCARSWIQYIDKLC